MPKSPKDMTVDEIFQRKDEVLKFLDGPQGKELTSRALELIEDEMDELNAELNSRKEEHARRQAIRDRVASGTVGVTIEKFGKDSEANMLDSREFYEKLIEKRAATNVAGMGNVIPVEIVKANIRAGKNGLFDDVSITNIRNGGSVKIPYIADSDLTVNAHTENAAITPAGTVPSVVTITHAERECTLGYSYLGIQVAISDLEDIMNESLMSALRRKLDSDAVTTVKGLTWATSGDNKNAVQWATSGTPTLDEIISLMKLLPERYANGAKFYMNKATSLDVIKNATGKMVSSDATVSNGMYNVSVTDGVSKIFGVDVVIDSNMANGDVLYGNPKAVHFNFCGDIMLNNWMDHDSLTEKMQIACAAGSGCEPKAFVLGANSIS